MADHSIGFAHRRINEVNERLDDLAKELREMRIGTDKTFNPVLETKIRELLETKKVSLVMSNGADCG